MERQLPSSHILQVWICELCLLGNFLRSANSERVFLPLRRLIPRRPSCGDANECLLAAVTRFHLLLGLNKQRHSRQQWRLKLDTPTPKPRRVSQDSRASPSHLQSSFGHDWYHSQNSWIKIQMSFRRWGGSFCLKHEWFEHSCNGSRLCLLSCCRGKIPWQRQWSGSQVKSAVGKEFGSAGCIVSTVRNPWMRVAM